VSRGSILLVSDLPPVARRVTVAQALEKVVPVEWSKRQPTEAAVPLQSKLGRWRAEQYWRHIGLEVPQPDSSGPDDALAGPVC
jgi:hypothetical protein